MALESIIVPLRHIDGGMVLTSQLVTRVKYRTALSTLAFMVIPTRTSWEEDYTYLLQASTQLVSILAVVNSERLVVAI